MRLRSWRADAVNRALATAATVARVTAARPAMVARLVMVEALAMVAEVLAAKPEAEARAAVAEPEASAAPVEPAAQTSAKA